MFGVDKMYIYLITNLVNGKKYVGQTTDYQRRMYQHKTRNEEIIDKKIQEYGVENFSFEIIEDNIDTQEELDEKEKYYISLFNTKIENGHGYNVQDGGKNNMIGANNSKAKLSEEQAQWILDNRNIKQRELYEQCTFKDKISFSQFCAIYNGHSWTHLKTDTEKANNIFASVGADNVRANYTEEEMYIIRERYAQGVHYLQVWEEFGKRGNPVAFFKIYNGQGYYNVHMDVFTEENRKKHKPDHSGENNGRSKLTKEDVLRIRELSAQGLSDGEINRTYYPQVSKSSIANIRLRRTWKNI